MPFSGGSFSLYPTGNPVVTGTPVASAWANNTLNDVATGLSTCILKDGSQTITANIPMDGFKFTGLAAGTTNGDSLRYEQAIGVFLPLAGGTMTGNLLFTDATYDIGASGATRPRNIFLSGNATIGGLTATRVPFAGTAGLLSDSSKLTWDGNQIAINNAAATPALSLTSASSIATLSVTDTGASGANIKLIGDGVVTQNKYIRAKAGVLEFVNSAYGAVIASLTDAGVFTANGIVGAVVFGTPVATTSGTTASFTALPSGVKRIIISVLGTSTNGTTNFLVQLSTSAAFVTSGYLSQATTAGGSRATSTAGLIVTSSVSASDTWRGSITLTLENSANNSWVSSGTLITTTGGAVEGVSAGSIAALGGVLDGVRLTTVGGDTFDAGEINIQYQS